MPADQVKPTGKRTRGKYVNVAELAKEKPSESEEKSELEDIAGKSLDDLMEKEGIEKPDNK